MASKVSANVSFPTGKDVQTDRGRRAKRAIEAACQALIGAEGELTELDRVTGDGDLGTSMKRAAEVVRGAVESFPLDDVSATLKDLGHTLRRELGGSSGPLYGVLFLRCGHILEDSGSTGPAQWAEAIDQGCRAIGELGGAKPGDRTMLDALDPFLESLKSNQGNLSRQALLAAVEEAERGVDATARMMPRLGRSSYLGDRVLGHPDPGAKAVAIWLRAASEALFAR
jgi:dihydroxyacetone kinase